MEELLYKLMSEDGNINDSDYKIAYTHEGGEEYITLLYKRGLCQEWSTTRIYENELPERKREINAIVSEIWKDSFRRQIEEKNAVLLEKKNIFDFLKKEEKSENEE